MMPKFRKLSPNEIEERKRKRTPRQDLGEYQAYLDSLKPGEWGEVTLEEGESQRAIKRRLTTAAKQKGMELRYKRAAEGQIVFEVR